MTAQRANKKLLALLTENPQNKVDIIDVLVAPAQRMSVYELLLRKFSQTVGGVCLRAARYVPP